ARMLWDGATYEQIQAGLGASRAVIARTRKELRIPLPWATTGRRIPAYELPRIEKRTAELLRDGATYDQITAELHISGNTVHRIRVRLG
ncbi:hypothetical protein HCJ99_33985, partial [Streptomyces sp. C1-2]|nr:hypothetical protein [Streptomyces sp. C1-2]